MAVRTVTLPPCLYYDLDDLAHEYGISRKRFDHWFDGGLVRPAAAIPRMRFGALVANGTSRYIVVPLHDYTCLQWEAHGGDERASLLGAFKGFYVDPDSAESGFQRNIDIEFRAPFPISREDLVLEAEQREVLESIQSMGRRRAPRVTNSWPAFAKWLIENNRSLTQLGPYAVAKRAIDDGVPLSDQTIANLIEAARPSNIVFGRAPGSRVPGLTWGGEAA